MLRYVPTAIFAEIRIGVGGRITRVFGVLVEMLRGKCFSLADLVGVCIMCG